jgi:Holliday junction resolvase RusA-like endonuclease
MNQFEADKNMPHFVIQGTFPTLNEYLTEEGRHPMAGGRMKRQYMDDASWQIRSQLRGYHAEHKVILHYHFYEPNMKRDKDNVFAFASKTIQDSLQKCKVIDNDGWKNVENFTHDFFVDKDNPRIEVYIEELQDDDVSKM